MEFLVVYVVITAIGVKIQPDLSIIYYFVVLLYNMAKIDTDERWVYNDINKFVFTKVTQYESYINIKQKIKSKF